MITDTDIARICASSYDPKQPWDKLWDGTSSDGIYAGLTGNVLCFRGSTTIEDWFRDLKAEAVIDPVLGGLHSGFAEGMPAYFAEVIQFLHRDSIICGHSLGAARALILAGYMMKAGIPPRAVIVFGCPRPGFKQLADILSAHPQARSHRNRGDIVTDVPRALEIPYLPFVDAIPPIEQAVASAPWDLSLFAKHHIGLYIAGTPAIEIAALRYA